MTVPKPIINELFILLVLGIVAGSGCILREKRLVVEPKTPLVKQEPTCQEVLSNGLHGISNYEIATLLDGALSNHETNDCWIPLITLCLNENREIPRTHVAEAVKVFNMKRHEALFHKAVYRYFAHIAKGKSHYRPEDRLLLTSYCSYLINSATHANDINLSQAQMLCRKLDPELYGKFFR